MSSPKPGRKALVAERRRFDKLHAKRKSTKAFDFELFAAGVAHEFNNILGAADGHAEWALESGKADDMTEALRVVRIACGRSARITRALQGIFQPREDAARSFDFRDLGNDLNRIYGPICERAGIRWELKSVSVRVHGNADRLLEVLVNLVKNSVEAIAEAGGANHFLRVAARATGRSLAVVVADSGPGVPKIYRTTIFDPFFTTKGVLTNVRSGLPSATPESGPGGTGLGLYLSRQVIEEHGGRLTLEASSRGAKFAIRLPIAARKR